MEWCKLYSRYPDDPAIIAAGEFAEVLFFRSCAYATDKETKGFVPSYQPARFGLQEIKRVPASRLADRIAALVDNQLWLVVEGGWKIRNYERLQAELTALMRKREADRERQRKRRESRDNSRDKSLDSHAGNRATSVLVSGYVSSPGVEIEIEKSQTLADDADTTLDNPSPAQAPGPLEEPSGHSGQHPNCRACGTNQRRRGTNPRALHAVAELPPRYCGQCFTTYPVRKGRDGRYLDCPTCHPSAKTA